MSINKYRIFITYHTVEISTQEVYASDEEQASEIALIGWRDIHTEKCLNPQVKKIEEITKPKDEKGKP